MSTSDVSTSDLTTLGQPVRFYTRTYHDHVNAGLYLPLDNALHFYHWMLANQYFTPTAENYSHIGYWIKRGLIVVKFEYDDFAQLAGVSRKTLSRQLAKIVEHGFGVVLQEGGFLRGDEKRAPFVVAIGCWQHGPDSARIPHYVGWMNALKGKGGHITIDELADHVEKIAERGSKARAHLGVAREKWARKREFVIAEEQIAGKTELSSREDEDPGKTNVSSRGKTELSSHGKTNLSSVNTDNSTQMTSTQMVSSAAPLRSAPAGYTGVKRRVVPAHLTAAFTKDREEALQPAAGDEGGREAAEIHPPSATVQAPQAPFDPLIDGLAVEDDDTPSLAADFPNVPQDRAKAAPEVKAAPINAAKAKEPTPIARPPSRDRKSAKPKKSGDDLAGKYPPGVHAAMTKAVGDACYPAGGVPNGKWGLIGTKASEMLDLGYTPEDAAEIGEFLRKDPFWREKISPGVLLNEAPRWKSAKRPPHRNPSAVAPVEQEEEVTPELLALVEEMNEKRKHDPFAEVNKGLLR